MAERCTADDDGIRSWAARHGGPGDGAGRTGIELLDDPEGRFGELVSRTGVGK